MGAYGIPGPPSIGAWPIATLPPAALVRTANSWMRRVLPLPASPPIKQDGRAPLKRLSKGIVECPHLRLAADQDRAADPPGHALALRGAAPRTWPVIS